MFKLLRYLNQKQWRQVALGLLFILGQVYLDLKLPEYMSQITTLVQTPGSSQREVWITGGYMLLCALGSVLCAFVIGFLSAQITASFSRDLRSRLFHKVDSFSMEEINRFSTSSLIIRSTNDITQVELLLGMLLSMVVRAPITIVWALVKIIGKGSAWTMATLVDAILMASVMLGIILVLNPIFTKIQGMTDKINGLTRENLQGLRVIRAYNAKEYQEDKFETANQSLTKANLTTMRTMALMNPAMNVLVNILGVALYWIGALLMNQASVGDRVIIYSDTVSFVFYSLQILMAFMTLAMTFIFLPRARVSAKRINEVLDTHSNIIYGEVADGKAGIKGKIEFRNVGFRYPDARESVLQNINFTVNQGETIAFIGSTGSGKSTLVNLVPRFFDVTEGSILIDDVDIRDYEKNALYRKIGYVPQKAVMFKGTVESNVAFGEKGDRPALDEVKRAVEIAQSADFVEKMDGEYQAEIAQGGTNLSGGQKQRLSIARAINKQPEIYIFDDSFSALDYKTDRALRHELKKEMTGVTSMIVAQRISTIMDADKIVVLEEGRIAGIGTHRELLQSCSIYREIAENQLSKEELYA